MITELRQRRWLPFVKSTEEQTLIFRRKSGPGNAVHWTERFNNILFGLAKTGELTSQLRQVHPLHLQHGQKAGRATKSGATLTQWRDQWQSDRWQDYH